MFAVPFVPEGPPGDRYPKTRSLDFSQHVESSEQEDYLTASTPTRHPSSCSPSAMPSPNLPTEPPISNLWNSRYDIHAKAFSALGDDIKALQPHLEPTSLRCILVPVIILSLVSRPNSKERALCTWYFAKFEEFVASPPSSPAGGEKLHVDIPWEKLDAYSEAVEMEGGTAARAGSMKESAPEWNWWDMLKQIDLNLSCKCSLIAPHIINDPGAHSLTGPVTTGHSHLERGSEFWAFKLIASVANEECFKAWLREPTPSDG